VNSPIIKSCDLESRTRQQLKSKIRELYHERRRLEKRIAELRRGYRRVVESVRVALHRCSVGHVYRPDYEPARPSFPPAVREAIAPPGDFENNGFGNDRTTTDDVH
jgi:hypothetical protein